MIVRDGSENVQLQRDKTLCALLDHRTIEDSAINHLGMCPAGDLISSTHSSADVEQIDA